MQIIQRAASSIHMWSYLLPPEQRAPMDTLVEKRASIRHISPQTIRSMAKGGISPGLIKNMGQGALVPIQMGPLVPVCATNRD
jgi:hypothetical protein